MIRAALPVVVLAVAAMAGCVGPDKEDGPPDGMWEPEMPPAEGDVLFVYANHPREGDVDAPVTLLAWEAPGCSNCKFFHLGDYEGSLGDIRERFIETGKVGMYGIQLTIGYDYDIRGGIALQCAFVHAGDDAYWGFMDWIFDNQGAEREAIRAGLQTVASGDELEATQTCFDDEATQGNLQRDFDLAQEFGLRTSPGFIVIDVDGVYGPYTSSQVANELERLTAS